MNTVPQLTLVLRPIFSIGLIISLMNACEKDLSETEVEEDLGSIGVLEDMNAQNPDMMRRPSLDLEVMAGMEISNDMTSMDDMDPISDMEMATDMGPISDMEMLMPDMEMLMPDMEMLMPDMEMLMPDMEMLMPDMEMLMPDMEMLMPDMELPINQLPLNAPCLRTHDESLLALEERCESGLSCQIDPRWVMLDNLEEDENLALGQGRCLSEIEEVLIQEVQRGQACDTEERHFSCAGATLCFDPTEVTSIEEAELQANNRDGVCYLARPILSAEESREVSLDSGQSTLYQLVAATDSELRIETSGQCNQESSLKLVVAQRDQDTNTWTVLNVSQSNHQADHQCPSISLELEGNILTYVLLMRDTYQTDPDDEALTYNINIRLIAPDEDQDGVPDEFDCAPNNPDIPGPIEVPNNGLDDDCEPLTPDTLISNNQECLRNQPFTCGDQVCINGELLPDDCFFDNLSDFEFEIDGFADCYLNGEIDVNCSQTISCIRGSGGPECDAAFSCPSTPDQNRQTCDIYGYCVLGETDGLGLCDQDFDYFNTELVSFNERCDMNEIQTQCDPFNLTCFDGAIRGLEGLDNPNSSQSRAIKDGDGLCIEVVAAIEENGTGPVNLDPNGMIAYSLYYIQPSNLTITLTPNTEEACPLSPEIKIFGTEFDDFGFLIPYFITAAGAESAGPDNCAQLSLDMVSDEIIILVNEADPNLSINATLNWQVEN